MSIMWTTSKIMKDSDIEIKLHRSKRTRTAASLLVEEDHNFYKEVVHFRTVESSKEAIDS